ncbi:MAG: hypothetical protein ABFE13_11530 [Phycisphaerales bacterium]
MSKEVFYKVLDAKGCPIYGTGKWNLPRGKHPGAWMPHREPVLCESGYHGCRRDHLVEWLNARIFTMETRGELIEGDNKIVAAEARLVREFKTWNERTARLFAADCAERALRREKRAGRNPHPDSWTAIKAARAFANDKISADDLSAGWAAASAAARDTGAAAWAAASAAACSARAAAWSARAAAWDARDAAWDARAAAWDARDAAWDAERAWQTCRLFEYLEGKRG